MGGQKPRGGHDEGRLRDESGDNINPHAELIYSGFGQSGIASRPSGGKNYMAISGEHKRGCTYAELLVFLIIVKVLQECEELLLVPSEDRFDLRRFLRVGNEHLNPVRRTRATMETEQRTLNT